MLENEKFNVGDAIKVFAPTPNSPFYLVGRIIYIDEINDEYEYGIIYYGRNSKILVIHVTAHRTKTSPVPNPPSCPSHGFTMDYVNEMVEREKSETQQTRSGTLIKNMQIGGECGITAIFKDGREATDWSFEEDHNRELTLTDSENNEITTEEELRELGIEQIDIYESYTLWS